MKKKMNIKQIFTMIIFAGLSTACGTWNAEPGQEYQDVELRWESCQVGNSGPNFCNNLEGMKLIGLKTQNHALTSEEAKTVEKVNINKEVLDLVKVETKVKYVELPVAGNFKVLSDKVLLDSLSLGNGCIGDMAVSYKVVNGKAFLKPLSYAPNKKSGPDCKYVDPIQFEGKIEVKVDNRIQIKSN